MANDVFSKQFKDVEGLSASDNKFLRRFVGLMAVKGMPCYKHGASSRRKTVLKCNPTGTTLFWDSKNKAAKDAAIDLGTEAKDVVKGQVYSWFRSISMDPECCVSVLCHPGPGARAGAKAKRLDLELESRDDATLLYAALSVLSSARKPDALKAKVDAEDIGGADNDDE